MKVSLLCLASLCAISAVAQEPNHKIADNALQPSVNINADDPKNIVIAASGDVISYSLDGGVTWLEGKLKPAPSNGVRDNPVLKSGTSGDFYLVSTETVTVDGKELHNIIGQSSKSQGKFWGVPAVLGTAGKESTMPQSVAHSDKNKVGVVWVQTDAANSQDPACKSSVYYSQSGNGESWSDAELLSQTSGDCTDSDNALHSPSVAMDDDRKIFVLWELKNSMYMDRTYDAAKTWLANDMTGLKMEGQRAYTIPGIGPATRKPLMVQDVSRSIYRNSIYLAWADQRNGTDDTDIMLATSLRRGDSWSPPVRVNTDEKGKHQFMPAITVDSGTGVIYVVYYDRRNYTDNQTDVYLAWSFDGGAKFKEKKISDTPFVPEEGKPFTGSIAISAVKGNIVPVWVRVDGGVPSVWTTVIRQEKLLDPIDMPKILTQQRRPVTTRPVQQGVYQSRQRRPGQY